MAQKARFAWRKPPSRFAKAMPMGADSTVLRNRVSTLGRATAFGTRKSPVAPGSSTSASGLPAALVLMRTRSGKRLSGGVRCAYGCYRQRRAHSKSQQVDKSTRNSITPGCRTQRTESHLAGGSFVNAFALLRHRAALGSDPERYLPGVS